MNETANKNKNKIGFQSKRSKIFKWVLILLGLIALIALVHLFVFVVLPFIIKMHGF